MYTINGSSKELSNEYRTFQPCYDIQGFFMIDSHKIERRESAGRSPG